MADKRVKTKAEINQALAKLLDRPNDKKHSLVALTRENFEPKRSAAKTESERFQEPKISDKTKDLRPELLKIVSIGGLVLLILVVLSFFEDKNQFLLKLGDRLFQKLGLNI